MGLKWNKYNNSGFNANTNQLPFIFCEVLNFGGNNGFYGGYKLITELSSKNVLQGYEKLEGIGLLSEGLETN
jgi:alpha-N-acetylglucosaminidase